MQIGYCSVSLVTFEDRFWSKVDVRDFNSCWLWTGWVCNGYGRFGPKKEYCHRIAWELLIAPIPQGVVIDHDHPRRGCKNGLCVNPAHLDVVPRGVNTHRWRATRRNNTSGCPNVYWHNARKRWRAEIRMHGKTFTGPFRVAVEEAAADLPGVEQRAIPDDCEVVGCRKPAVKGSFCGMHFQRVQRYGGPGPAGPMGKADSLENRFLDAVHVRGDCHIWFGSVNGGGYGTIGYKGGKVYAHSAAFWLAYGHFPYGRVTWLCENRKRCVRVDHLRDSGSL